MLLLFGICVCLVLPHGRMNILLGLFPLFNRIKYLYFYYTFVGVCYIYNNNNNNNNNKYARRTETWMISTGGIPIALTQKGSTHFSKNPPRCVSQNGEIKRILA